MVFSAASFASKRSFAALDSACSTSTLACASLRIAETVSRLLEVSISACRSDLAAWVSEAVRVMMGEGEGDG